ncbi:MAG: Mov34/MPN/PAD-1 family protein [Thermoplasmatota archaeon]
MMTSDQVVDVRSAELLCMDVRRGDRTLILSLAEPYLGKKTGVLSSLMGKRKYTLEPNSMLASSEALSAVGSYRFAVKPLEELVGIVGLSRDVKRIALARAGQLTISHGLPIDLGPIISELGLTRRDLESALKYLRRGRERKNDLPEMESRLMQAMLLDRNSDIVESPSLAMEYLRGAVSEFDSASSHAAGLEGSIKTYHSTRCMLHKARFLLERGDQNIGIGMLEAVLRRCGESSFKVMKMEALVLMGEFSDSESAARESLVEASYTTKELENRPLQAASLFIRGARSCSDAADEKSAREGIDSMLAAADLLEGTKNDPVVVEYRLDAALWAIRTGEHELGLDQARKAYRSVKTGLDPELGIRAQVLVLYAHLGLDNRKKARSLLMDLVSNNPVKQYPATFSILKEAVRDVLWLREDKDTSELFEEEVVYEIEKDAVDEIIRRAKEAYPNEFGAMLRGMTRITHIEPVMEGAGNRNSYLFSLYSRFSQRNVEGEGVVHSHPSGSARPSRADLSMFGRFPGINIIIGYPFSEDSMAAYDRLGNRVRLVITKSGLKRRNE